ncbi:hypothetical protein ES702_04918 [subsurface metagenome]
MNELKERLFEIELKEFKDKLGLPGEVANVAISEARTILVTVIGEVK